MVREAGVPTIFVVRLGVAGQQIAEIETLVIRNQMAGGESRSRGSATGRLV
jgi:hypothetical protein